MTEAQLVALIASQVIGEIKESRLLGTHLKRPRRIVPINVSARHVHLSLQHVEALFGPGYRLSPLKALRQPGQFAAVETVKLVGPRSSISNVRILGPAREDTQVEISLTDARTLGLDVPVRLSGNIAGTPGVLLAGPFGSLELRHGLIVAARHVHLGPEDARHFSVIQGQRVCVRTNGTRSLTFDDVVVRVHDQFVPEMHVDTDEANAAGIRDGSLGEIVVD